MSDIFTIFAKIIIVALSFLFGEIFLSIIFDTRGGWKFRWSSVKGHSHLRPFAKTWKIATVFIFAILVFIPLLDLFLWNIGINLLIDFKWYLISALIIILSILYIWTTKVIMHRKFNLYDLIPIGLIFLTLVISFLVRYS